VAYRQAQIPRSNSLFFLQSGMVSVKLPSGVRLASLGPGMEFGEMAIIEQYRSADVWADAPLICLELPLDSFADYRRLHPQIAMKIMRNLSTQLARRLILANAKVDLLSAYWKRAISQRRLRRSEQHARIAAAADALGRAGLGR
jgi:CRP-like cAMP-binding protein